jgi:hypothetical protein
LEDSIVFSDSCCQNEKEWERFVGDLKDGDRVAVQLFHPHETRAFDNASQYWELHEGKYRIINGRSEVRYQNDSVFVIDGTLRYHDGSEWGKVFPGRVVRWADELAMPEPPRFRRHMGQDYYRSARPIYEPLWCSQAFLLERHGPGHGKIYPRLGKEGIDFKHHQRKVDGGNSSPSVLQQLRNDGEI